MGRSIVEASAGNLKRVQLELGGKGANIVFDDADLDAAVNGSAFAIFHNQGQACIAGSRLILHEPIADEFLERFVALARSIRLGDPLDPATEMGPLTSPEHRDRVLGYVKIALDEGAEILTGGNAPMIPRSRTAATSSPQWCGPGRQDSRVPGGGVRPLRHGHHVPNERKRHSRSPTAPSTAWAPGCGRATCNEPTGWPTSWTPGWCG